VAEGDNTEHIAIAIILFVQGLGFVPSLVFNKCTHSVHAGLGLAVEGVTATLHSITA